MKSLKDLEDLTARLPAWKDIPKTTSENGKLHTAFTAGGEVCMNNLYTDPDGLVAMAFCTMPAGTEVSIHQHDAAEWMLFISGQFILHRTDKPDKTIGPAECVHVAPNDPHGGTVIEETTFLAVTWPADEGYPNATAPPSE